MYKPTKILIGAFVALVASSTLSQAQVRDATSKALGNYAHSQQNQTTYLVPFAPTAQSGAMAARPGQSATRVFSYDARSQAPPCGTVTQATPAQAANQPAPSQAVRRFSYEPGYTAPRPSYFPSRSWQGVRDAGSKVRGDY